MRTTWRTVILFLLAGLWPQLGCHQLPANKSVQDLRPIQQKDGAVPKQELTAVEIGKSLAVQATALEDARKATEAIAMYEKIRATDAAQAPHATRKLAILYLRTNDLDRAEQEYQILLQQNPRDPDLLCAMGDISYRRGHFGTAEKKFRDALSRKPDHANAIINLGMTLAQRGEYDESRETFKKVVSEAEAYCEIAFVMKLNNKHEDAMRAYQTALTKDPNLQRAQAEMTQMYQSDPGLAVRMTTPYRAEKRGSVDLEPSTPTLVSDGAGRTMMQRPTLPPVPDFDLNESNGRDWQTSGKKK